MKVTRLLDYSPATDVIESGWAIASVQSKSSPLPGLLNTIIPPSTLGQVPFRIPVKGLFAGNATEVVFLLHSIDPEYLEALSAKRLSQPLLKYQLGQLWPTGFLLASTTRGRGYNIVTDNANSIAASALPILGGGSFTALFIDELRPHISQSTLPEYDVEVLL